MREHKRREQEVARTELADYYAQQRAMDAASTSASKDEQKRRQRVQRERQAEFALLDNLAKAERLQQLAHVRHEEEGRIAAVLEQRQHDAERSEKELQRLRNESSELRELQEQIKTAKVAMARQMQLQEQRMKQAREREYNVAFDQYMDHERQQALAKEAEEAAQRKAGSSQARLDLEAQMLEKIDLQRKQQEEFARERAMVDDVVARIEAEDRAEHEARRQRQRDTQAYVQNFLAEQTQLKQRRQEELEEEDRRIRAYMAERQAREDAEAAKKAAKKESADRIYERLKGEQEAAQARRDEEDRLINLLQAEEEAERARLDAEERRRKQDEARADMMAANERQKQIKAERLAHERAEEDEFRRRTLERFAEEDRLEQMNAQKRRLKVAEHVREVNRLVAEKRAMYEAARAAEAAEEARAAEEEARKAGLVRGERQRLLREAAHLREYLPKGMLRDMEDLHLVQETADQQQMQQGTGPPGDVQQYQHQEPRLHYANYIPEDIKQRPLEPATLDYTYYRKH